MHLEIVPHLILLSSDKQNVLLIKRAQNHKLWAGHWHCVAGKIEDGESPRDAIVREAFEEIGLVISEPVLKCTVSARTIDYFDNCSIFESTQLFFMAELPHNQTPVNMEPQKHEDIGWFAITDLPQPMIPVVDFGLQAFQNNQYYAEFYA